MTNDDTTPSPFQIADHPELAILAALDAAALLARNALFAAHPSLMGEGDPDRTDLEAWVALQLVGLAALIQDQVAAYRRIAELPPCRRNGALVDERDPF